MVLACAERSQVRRDWDDLWPPTFRRILRGASGWRDPDDESPPSANEREERKVRAS